MKKFIVGFDDNLKVIKKTDEYEDDALFYIIKDLESNTFKFKFTKEVNNIIILYAYEFLCAYLHMSELLNDLNVTKHILFDEKMNYNEASSLEQLLNKLEICLHTMCNDVSIDKMRDSFFSLALDNLMDFYKEEELKKYWENFNL